jgi:hypothetical protein
MLDVSSLVPNSQPVDEAAGCQAYCSITVGCNGYDFCSNPAGCVGYCISHNSLNPAGDLNIYLYIESLSRAVRSHCMLHAVTELRLP